MKNTIEITEACIGCGRCARVCPSSVIEHRGGERSRLAVAIVRSDECIACGHCAAVCPAGALRHQAFPPEKLHAFSRADLPAPEAVELLVAARRSSRVFTDEAVPHEYLERIAAAAHRAPSASNGRSLRYALATSPEALRCLSEFTLEVFTGKMRLLKNPLLKPVLRRIFAGAYRYIPTVERLRDNYAAGRDGILRGAKAVLLVYAPDGGMMTLADANLAYQNASLVAETLGVGQFYTGFVCMAASMRRGELERRLGLDGRIYAAMALGMPALRFAKYVDREEMDLREL